MTLIPSKSDIMTLIPSKSDFIAKNYQGDNRWRRSELEFIAKEMNLELYTEDTNQDVFERILIELIKQNEKEEIIKIMLGNPRISNIYELFINQLPNIEILKNEEFNEELDYELFIKYNIDNFFLQDKPSFDFLEYFLSNKTYKIKETNSWVPQKSQYIFFHPNGKYIIL